MENITDINTSRKYFIDNIRSTAVLIVIVYHVIYLFNGVGVPKTIAGTGIQAFEVFLYFVSPWIMNLMFLLAGISAGYSLQKRNRKEFFNERVQKLLLTFVGGMFLLAWINGWVADRSFNTFGESDIPVFVKYIIYCLHIGPLWFNLQLFVVSIVLLLIIKIDKRDRLWTLAGKANIFVLITLVLPLWGSSFLLNVPVLTMFRNGMYIFVFLAGYFLFSQEKIMEIIVKFRLVLFFAGLVLAVSNVYYFFGQNYTEDYCLQHPLTNIYAWIMMLGILGCFRKYFNKTNRFLDYLKSRSFFWYLTHMPIMAFIAYFITTTFTFPMILNYILILIVALVLTITFCEIVRLIPILRYFLFGIGVKRRI